MSVRVSYLGRINLTQGGKLRTINGLWVNDGPHATPRIEWYDHEVCLVREM